MSVRSRGEAGLGVTRFKADMGRYKWERCRMRNGADDWV